MESDSKRRLSVIARDRDGLAVGNPLFELVEREICFDQERVGTVTRFLVASPADRRRPDAVLANCAVVRRRRGRAALVDTGSSAIRRLRVGQPSRRHLNEPAGARGISKRADVNTECGREFL
jgi:hypothetical protein